MRSFKFPVVPTLLFAALVAAALVDCGGDDTGDTTGAGGTGGTSSGSAGTSSGTAGISTTGASGSATGGAAGQATGGGGMGGAGTGGGGSAGSGGKAGAGGTADAGDSGAKADSEASACAIHNVIHTAPTVPSAIALPVVGATLVGGYAASGVQIYTCTKSILDDGDGGDGGLVGTWVNTATATLSGDNCATAAQHAFSPGPTWTATDGSAVSAKKGPTAPAPAVDGGDGGVTSIAWVLLQQTANVTADGGGGVFSNVTWVQRVNTSGGVGPSGSCDPALSGADGGVVKVPYTADYFFYTGGTNPEAGTDAGAADAGAAEASDDGSADSGG